MRIRFDQGPDGAAAWFAAPRRLIVAQGPGDVPGALAALDMARAGGAWLAGYASYELGYALELKLASLMPPHRRLPLLCFGVYDGPEAGELAAGPASVDSLTPEWNFARYAAAYTRVHGLIGAGDIYQANLTFPLAAKVQGGAEALYAALADRHPVGHGALVLQDGLPDLLSRSPELFFETDAAGGIVTRPMKGTMPRGRTPDADRANVEFLAADPKNRAENLMIVDLLRNDLSRIARVGSVRVPRLFEVETYRSVHQMVSEIRADLLPGTGLGAILTALFPCGSITGAPKVRAMEVIRELEPDPRDIYCGSIGWAAPDGRASFNVAIRTLMRTNDTARLNVGGGVVWDSTAEAEYEEALWKARYTAPFQTAHD